MDRQREAAMKKLEGKGGKVPMEPVVKQVNIQIAHSSSL